MQAREWEEAEAAAGARYNRRGNLFGAGGSSVGGAGPQSLSGISSVEAGGSGPRQYGKSGVSPGSEDPGSSGGLRERPSGSVTDVMATAARV